MAGSLQPPRSSCSPPRVAYVMSRFPRLSETFVLYELLAVEHAGVHIDLYPLLRERAAVTHPEAAPLVERARYQPFLSWPILRSHAHFLRRCPRRYLATLGSLLVGVAGSLNFTLGAIGIWAKVVHMARLMAADGVTHVHCHFATHPAVAGWVVRRLVGIPFSFTAHGSDLHVDRHMLPQKVAEAAFVLAISEYNRDLIIAECGPETAHKVRVLHCGVDPERFRPAGPPPPDPVVRILCIGTLHQVKGQRYLLEACRLLNAQGIDVHCTLVGDGPDRKTLQRLVSRWGLDDRVELAGRRTQDEIAALLATTHILAAPSVRTREGKREGIPVVLMEAMSAEVPVVASDLSGIPELVEDERSGLLVPPGNAAALAATLRRLCDDPVLRRRLGQQGRRKVVREFNLHSNAALLAAEFSAVEEPDHPRHGGEMSVRGTGMLGQTLATDFVVGSNASGTANGNWPFLLPALRVGTVVCCGTPTLAALRTLAGMARDVMVCPPSRPNRSAVLRARAEGLANVHAREVSTLEAGSAEVAWLGTRPSPALLDTLDRLLTPGGLLFSEEPHRLPRSGWCARAEFWSAPRGHDVQLAVPARDLSVIDWARRGGLAEPTRGRMARRVCRRLPFLANLPATRHTALVARDGAPRHSLPAYVLEIAQAGGVPLEDRPWAFWAPGRYPSKKILFFAFDRDGARPEIVVRLTRSAALNYRLENEWRALCQIERSGAPDAETVPQPRFFGYHGGLAVLGESAVDGEPFQQRSSARDDCPYGRTAVEWLVDLGVRTADHRSFGPGEIAGAVSAIHDRFTRTYTLSPEHRRALAAYVGALGTDLPTVRQHGDPGTWNLLVTPTGRVAVLDWEAYEQHGMPLWDLFYFMRSYGVWASRVDGTRDPLDGYARRFFADSPMNRLLTSAVAQFGDRADLARELVEPLFFTCWMHRAVKESARLEPQRLERGHFVRLLRRCLDERRSPGLRRLFAAGA